MPSMGNVPLDEMEPRIGAKLKDGGPKVVVCTGLIAKGWPALLGLRVKMGLRLLDAAELKLESARSCFASTGRFCVTTWPKFEPKPPLSKPRAHPRGTRVLGSN